MRTFVVFSVVVLLLAFSGQTTVYAQDGGGFNPQDQQPPPEGGTVSPFNISMEGLVDTASNFFNNLWPVFAVIVGVGLGLFILKFVLASIKGAAGSG